MMLFMQISNTGLPSPIGTPAAAQAGLARNFWKFLRWFLGVGGGT